MIDSDTKMNESSVSNNQNIDTELAFDHKYDGGDDRKLGRDDALKDSKMRQAKRIFFYRDGDGFGKGSTVKGVVKLAVHPSRYRSLDALLNELTNKMPELSYGVRSVFTPRGHNRLSSLNDLSHEGHYVCSQWVNRAKGIDKKRIISNNDMGNYTLPPWNSKKSNFETRFNTAPLGSGENDFRIKKARKRDEIKNAVEGPSSVPELESDHMRLERYKLAHFPPKRLPGLKRGDNKKLLVRKNGSSDQRHTVFLNRKMVKTFEYFLDDLSGVMMMPVRRLYTLDGKQVQSLSAIFNGPNVFVAAGYERFRPMAAWGTEPVIKENLLSIRPKVTKNTPRVNRGIWRVQVITSKSPPDAGTTANVFITIYGKFRSTNQLPLDTAIYDDDTDNHTVSPHSMFSAGQATNFEVNTGNIGTIVKIRMHHDNFGSSPNWLLESVHLENVDSAEKLTFDFNCWLSRSHDNGEICRELPAIYKDGPVLPMVKYKVTVITGDCWNAGTDANVFMCLYGEHGDSGMRQLLKPDQLSAKLFQKGHSNTFELDGVSLGRLKRMMVGHSGIGPGYGWFLDRVIVRVLPLQNQKIEREWEITFPCGRWLDHGEDDGKTSLELRPQDDFQHNQMEKEMWEYEKWKFQKGNRVLIYSPTTSKFLRISYRGEVDAFGEIKDKACVLEVIVGDRENVCAFHSCDYPGRVLTMRGTQLTGGTPRGGLQGVNSEFQLHIQPDRGTVLETVRQLQHHLTVNAHDGSITEARGPVTLPSKALYFYCKGLWRDKAVVCFCTSLIQTLAVTHDGSLTATGKRNRTAHFIVSLSVTDDGSKRFMFESVVFPNQYIRIRSGFCDVKGLGDRDCLFKIEKRKEKSYVTLQSDENKGLFLGMNSDGSVKPMVNTGDNNVRFYPELIKFGNAKKVPEESHRMIQPIDDTNDAIVEESAMNYIKTESPVIIAEMPDSEEKEYYTEGDWKVLVHSAQTAQRCYIHLTLYGDEGCSGAVLLGSPDKHRDLFQANNVDEFKIHIPLIGTLFKVRLETHPLEIGVSPFWCVKEVVLENFVTDERCIFPFNNRLFGRDNKDHELSREAALLTSGDMIPIVKYTIWLTTGSELGADCIAPLYIRIMGEYGDSGDRQFYSPFEDVQPCLQRGTTSEMTIECVYLGEITGCKITVQTDSPNTGWLCDSIIVEDPLTLTQVKFPAQRWFDLDKGDGQLSHVLKPEEYKVAEVEKDNEEDMIHKEAVELIKHITEEAANHLERFYEAQLKSRQVTPNQE